MGNYITCFPPRRRIRSTSGNKPNSTSIRRPSRLSRPANQRGCNFEYTQKNQPSHSKLKHMKKLITLTGIASIGAVLALISACQSTGTGGGVASQQGQAGGQPGQQLIQGQSLYPTMGTAGPNHIEVQQFGGFGPMGTAALGDW